MWSVAKKKKMEHLRQLSQFDRQLHITELSRLCGHNQKL